MSEKTLPPTPSRIRQARQDGQIGVSQDMIRIIKLMLIFELVFALEPIWRRWLNDQLEAAIRTISAPLDLSFQAAWDSMVSMFLTLAAMGVIAALLAFLLTMVQTRFNIAPKALAKGVDKLNPATNLKSLVSPQKLLMAVLGPIRGGLLLWVTYVHIRDQLPTLGKIYRVDPQQGWLLSMEMLHAVERSALIVLLLLAITDVLLQRYMTYRQLRMDHSELKRDYKQNEGDPMLKGARKQISQEIAMSDGPPGDGKAQQKASAVVVNPEHIAVALYFDPHLVEVPRLLHKGEGEDALALRRRAREDGIPVVKYVPLARHLFAGGRTGEEIPLVTYRAVALLLRVMQEYQKQAPEILIPSSPKPEAELELELPEVDEELGNSMFIRL